MKLFRARWTCPLCNGHSFTEIGTVRYCNNSQCLLMEQAKKPLARPLQRRRVKPHRRLRCESCDRQAEQSSKLCAECSALKNPGL